MKKTKEEIFTLATQYTCEFLDGLEQHKLNGVDSLAELGANSMDRAEIIALLLESLNLDIARIELFGAANLEQLVDLIHDKQA